MIPITADQASAALDPLNQFAPALASHFRALFGSDTDELGRLHALFNYCFLHGGREDRCMPRAEDESYNPRLARLSQLLISESGERTELVLSAAFLVTIDQVARLSAPADNEIKLLAEAALEKSEHSSTEAYAIALVFYLDQVRHLHQSTRNQLESASLLSDARALSERPLAGTRCNKLKKMLAYAVAQQERRCTK